MAKLKLHKISKVEANIEGQQVEKLTAAAVKAKNWFSNKINFAQKKKKIIP